MVDSSNRNVANASLDGLLDKVEPSLRRTLLPTKNTAEHEKAKLETTYNADFPPPFPYEMKTVAHSDYADKVNN